LLKESHSDRVVWYSALNEIVTPIRGAVIANEFLDTFPVHVFGVKGGELLELYVDTGPDGNLTTVFAPVSTSRLLEFIENYQIALAEGERIEVSMAAAAWMAELSRKFERGIATFIDYGDVQPGRYSVARRQGTLLGYRGGAVTDSPLIYPGEQDLTALVDFTHMKDAAVRSGLEFLAITRQAAFLIGLGLGEGDFAASAHGAVSEALAYRKGLQALISMEGLGRFHVMVLSKGVDAGETNGALSGLRYGDVL
jgi:SAM-dependent MidA family methyltransferase